jgi:ribonucleoside-diphosphate reductase alpha chain
MDKELSAKPALNGKKAGKKAKGPAAGLTVKRFFTTPGVDPADELAWEHRTAGISGEDGRAVFEQKEIEVPKSWSMLATNVVASKYFRGTPGTPERESSVRKLVARVVDTLTRWGQEGGYFATEADRDTFHAELTHLLLRQKAAFNSPVWFNVGVEEHPQCSACFINSVEDSMESILTLAKTEAMLFKYGSGTGSNLSSLRASKELLAGGGTASGPVSFMKGFDAFAGVIKSGGKTRRAAKMVILNAEHPDVLEFIRCKVAEEKKAWALIEAGYDASFNGAAYSSVFFQNSNNSVRVTDEFMKAVVNDGAWTTRAVRDGKPMDTYRARELFREIAEAAHLCGDPGMQFDSTVNAWHTCSGTARINASNPCVTGDTLVATSQGLRRIDSMLDAPAQVVGADGELHPISAAFPTGTKPVYQLRTQAGFELKLTADHRVLTRNRGDVPACELTVDDVLVLGRPRFGHERLDERLAEFLGLVMGDGCLMGEQETAMLTLSPEEEPLARAVRERLMAYKREHAADARAARDVEVTRPQGTVRLGTSARCVVDELKRLAVLAQGSEHKAFRDEVFSLDRDSIAAILRGLFTADGTVANYGEKSQYVSLDSTSLTLLRQVQQLLLGLGVKAKLYRDRRVLGQTMALLPDGKGGRKEYPVAQLHSLRISRSSRVRFEQEVGFLPESPKAAQLTELNQQVAAYEDRLEDRIVSLEFLGEQPVYDLTEPVTHHFVANGLVVHNCSEYMFLDDSACNLASLNLMHFRTIDGEFDATSFKHAVDVVLLAMEIIVGFSRYPTERITRNSLEYRPLGLGYANLGALLMATGLPYDSEQGRNYAAAITSLMCGQAYATSARIAERMGAFGGYAKNAEPMLGVIRKHRKAAYNLQAEGVAAELYEAQKAAWDEALARGTEHGYRNSQVTVLAPTGTIGFMMDCDTTGIEPDIALIKYKKLVGGGMLKIVNQTVPLALEKLGYPQTQAQDIISYLDQQETIEGAPHLKPEHLPVFDCAFKPARGERSIGWMGHIQMMEACQPFLSGAISKTVNMPSNATVEDIEKAYMEAWKRGLKAIAVYRDGCKRTQPLNTSKEQVKDTRAAAEPVVMHEPKAVRRRLPDERQSITHKFSIGGHEGYLTVGMYEDGTPGELFVVMAKEGSVVSGLMDSFATSVSLALQYGVPLQVLADKFCHTRFEPSGFTGNPAIPIAKSITDYIFRWLSLKFLPSEQPTEAEVVPAEVKAAPQIKPVQPAVTLKLPSSRQRDTWLNQADAPPCHTCGAIMVRGGACYKCANCGATSGCS